VSELGDRLLAVHDALDAAGMPHAIGGAIALGYCTLEPRGTRDLDLNVFVPAARAKEVFGALPSPIAFSGLDLEHAERDGQVRLWWDQTPIDLFFSVLPFHDQVAREVRQVTFEGRTIPVIGCHALALFKAMFDRTRDWADIESMIEARSIDVERIVAWIQGMAGEDCKEAAKLAALAPSAREP
jgi:hypothetical protein